MRKKNIHDHSYSNEYKTFIVLKINLLILDNVMFINEHLGVTDGNLTHVRKYQKDPTIPLVVICTEDYLSPTKGLAFRYDKVIKFH